MGQFYSTGHGTDSPENTTKKNDYYELIGVHWNASEEEIRRAYRKKALELHPDRNYGNAEAATGLFTEIQCAYEVLSDPQERAWYDSHRELFLGVGAQASSDYSHNIRMTTSDDIYKLFTRFNPRMEFSDSPSGFYGGLREMFSRLAWEEEMACQWDNVDFVRYPSFGYRNDDFKTTVRPFYAAWEAFSTKKSFAWKDVYRYSEAPDRRVRRMMEKENRRLRSEGIRDFNDSVRSLVSFIKKRDLRYRATPQSEAQRQDTLRRSAGSQATRTREANRTKLRQYVSQDWDKSEEPPEDRVDSSKNEVEHFNCVVCHKVFKSRQQFQAHERSKKHIKAAKKLCSEMITQDKQMGLGENNSSISAGSQVETQSDGDPISADSSVHEMSEAVPRDESLSKDVTGVQSSTQDVTNHTSGSGRPHPSDDIVYDSREHTGTQLSGWAASAPEGSENQNAIGALSTSNLRGSPKIGKAKQKRARKAAQGLDKSPNLTCASCNSSFTSRSQLFSHIRGI